MNVYLKSAVLVILAVIFLPSRPAFGQHLSQGLVESERSFAACSLAENTNAAFIRFMDKDGIIFNGHAQPVNGIETWKKRKIDTVKLRWAPEFVETDVSDSFGYTTGRWVYGSSSITSENSYGAFTSVWKKNEEGNWKVIADIGVDDPAMKPEFKKQTVVVINGKKTKDANADSRTIQIIDSVFNSEFTADRKVAYSKALSQQNILSRTGHALFTAKLNSNSAVSEMPDGLTFTSIKANISQQKDMAFAYGYVKLNSKISNYLRIWRHEKDGWKIAMELVAY